MNAKPIVSEIKREGKILNDINIISDKFNEYFVNVGPNLADKISRVNWDATDFITGSYLHSMSIQYTDSDEITKIVSILKSSSSTST